MSDNFRRNIFLVVWITAALLLAFGGAWAKPIDFTNVRQELETLWEQVCPTGYEVGVEPVDNGHLVSCFRELLPTATPTELPPTPTEALPTPTTPPEPTATPGDNGALWFIEPWDEDLTYNYPSFPAIEMGAFHPSGIAAVRMELRRDGQAVLSNSDYHAPYCLYTETPDRRGCAAWDLPPGQYVLRSFFRAVNGYNSPVISRSFSVNPYDVTPDPPEPTPTLEPPYPVDPTATPEPTLEPPYPVDPTATPEPTATVVDPPYPTDPTATPDPTATEPPPPTPTPTELPTELPPTATPPPGCPPCPNNSCTGVDPQTMSRSELLQLLNMILNILF